MKRFLIFFCVLLFACTPERAHNTQDSSDIYDLEGHWQLNNAMGHFGGVLEIYNCTSDKCDFKVESWFHQHLCDTDGQIELISATSGVYNSKQYMYDNAKDIEYSVPVGIYFELLPDGDLNLRYTTPDSYFAFCGMSATVEGVWTKQKN